MELSDGEYTLRLKEYESFDEKQTASTMTGAEKLKYLAQSKQVAKMTDIRLKIQDLDTFFAKRKDRKGLKERHIGALMKIRDR